MYSPTRFARWRLRLEADWAKHCVTSSNTGSGGKHQASKPPPPPPPCLDRRRGDNCSSRNLHQMESEFTKIHNHQSMSHFNTHTFQHIKSLLNFTTNGNCQSWNKNEKNKTATKRRMEPRSETHKLEDTRKHGGRVWWPKSFSIPLNEQLVQQLHYQNLDPGEAQTHHQLAAHHQISNFPYRPHLSISIKFHSFHNPKKAFFPHFQNSNCTRNTIRVCCRLSVG